MVNNLPANEGNVRDADLISGSGRSPEEGNGTPLQYSCLESPMGRGAWQATVHGATKSQTWLSNWAHTHTHTHTHTPLAYWSTFYNQVLSWLASGYPPIYSSPSSQGNPLKHKLFPDHLLPLGCPYPTLLWLSWSPCSSGICQVVLTSEPTTHCLLCLHYAWLHYAIFMTSLCICIILTVQN